MSNRKSLPKQKEILKWLNCEKCNIFITSTENHIDCDKSNYPIIYIKENTIFTNKIEVNAIETNLSSENLKNIIFINETAMKICQMKIGDNVIIKIQENNETRRMVKYVWPISDSNFHVIMIPKEGLPDRGNKITLINGEISKLTESVLSASEIFLEPCIDGIASSTNNDIIHVIKKSCYNNILSTSNTIEINFFNKIMKFNINSIKSYKTENVPDDPSSEKNLIEKIKDLSIKEDYFLVTSRTNFFIQQSSQNCMKIDEHNPDIVIGLDNVLNEIKQLINFSINNTDIKSIKSTRTVLLHGPAGCGKSLICRSLSKQLNYITININASEIFSKYYGESESNLTGYFDQAFANYPNPTLIIFEELKNICPKSNTVDAVKRVSSLFCNLLDDLHNKIKGSKCFLIATVDNPDNLNSSVRRSGRLDCEVEIPVPTPEVRLKLLKHLLICETEIKENEIEEIAKITHGFVGSDLISLVTKASMNALQRGNQRILLNDINTALIYIKPSAMREVLIESPNVKWTDVGGQHDLKLKLKQAVEWPITHPEVFTKLGIRPPRGVLMFGPPGCSKTMIAKALATESNLNFLSIKGPELFSMWVGESERAVRDLFKKARQVSPSIIFFDEIDALGSERSSESGSSVKERVLAQILTELDGVNSLNDVVIVAATNRPDLIDKALLRPGRIDRIIYVKLPDYETRKEIFNLKLSKSKLSTDVDVDELSQKTDGCSGAEIQAICNEAAMKALEENMEATEITKQHFLYACNLIKPRTSEQLLDLYEKYLKEF